MEQKPFAVKKYYFRWQFEPRTFSRYLTNEWPYSFFRSEAPDSWEHCQIRSDTGQICPRIIQNVLIEHGLDWICTVAYSSPSTYRDCSSSFLLLFVLLWSVVRNVSCTCTFLHFLLSFGFTLPLMGLHFWLPNSQSWRQKSGICSSIAHLEIFQRLLPDQARQDNRIRPGSELHFWLSPARNSLCWRVL